jgi:hypothetical protein
MSVGSKWRVFSQLSVLAVGVAVAAAAPASAAPLAAAPTVTGTPLRPTAYEAPPGSVFLAANLRGRNEVPPADPDGRARMVIRIQGTQVCFTMSWDGIAAPSAAHIHTGAVGVNGGIAVGLFAPPAQGVALPGTIHTVSGCATATEAQVAAITAAPADFYVNLHNADFPGGAVRGQLHASAPVDLNGFLRGSLVALADGAQETPALGDPDGRATAFLKGHRDRLSYAVAWQGIAQPKAGHVHIGRFGQPGDIAVGLFGGDFPLPATLTGIAGEVGGLDANVVRQISRRPVNYYVNLHNAEFPGGAVRGQLFRAGSDDASDATFTAPVVRGVQIYACTQQADGTFKFTQHNVRALLQGNIRHSFVNNVTGPPRWVAPDGSAVSGRVITRTPNGDGNIPELELEATQIGAADGRFARTVEILRLNTVGGVAPAGACDPKRQPLVEVPYRADYVFIAA